MGGGDSRDRQDRSGEYQSREPSGEGVTSAQKKLDAFGTDDDGTEGEVSDESEERESGNGGVETFVEGDSNEEQMATASDANEGGVGTDGEMPGTGVESETAGEEVTAETEDDSGNAEGDGTGQTGGADDGEITVNGETFDDPNEAARHLGATDEQTIAVDLGETDPETIEDEFGLDLSETKTISDVQRSDTDHEYPKLEFEQTQNVREALEEKHGEDVYEDLDHLMQKWKGGEEKSDKQTLELIAKKANGIGQPVRRGGEKARDVDPDDPRIDAYRDLSRISRGFMKENIAEGEEGDASMTVHRGVRMANEALTAQFIDNPSADAYRLQTSSISNHSTDDGVADTWGDPYTISHDIQPDDVTLAIDHINVTGVNEGEVHIDSDDITVDADRIGFSRTQHLHGDNETVDDVFDAFSNPETASKRDHRDVQKLIESMQERDEVPRTEEGARNLIDYFDGIAGHEDLSRRRTRETQQLVNETLDSMDTGRSIRGDSATIGAITDPESASPKDHERAKKFISAHSQGGIRDEHTDEDAEQLAGWLNHLADEQPMDDRNLRSAHRSVNEVLDEADTDVTIDIDRFDMTR